MLRAIHLNLAEREVLLVDERPGHHYGRITVLSDGTNGRPSFDQFTKALERTLGDLVGEVEDLLGDLDKEPAPGPETVPSAPTPSASVPEAEEGPTPAPEAVPSAPAPEEATGPDEGAGPSEPDEEIPPATPDDAPRSADS